MSVCAVRERTARVNGSSGVTSVTFGGSGSCLLAGMGDDEQVGATLESGKPLAAAQRALVAMGTRGRAEAKEILGAVFVVGRGWGGAGAERQLQPLQFVAADGVK